MNTHINAHRPWITPLVMGSFTLSGVTGVLMFFHLDSGLNKAAHEWLSWVMLAGVGLHVLLNWNPFKRYLSQVTARWVLGASALVLGLSFVPLGGAGTPPFVVPIQALAAAPLPVLASVAGVDVAEVQRRLAAAQPGSTDPKHTVAQRAGPDLKAQAKLLNAVLKPANAARP